MNYHLDYETFSTRDLRELGAFVYAEDPQAEVLCAAIATDDEGPYLWINEKYGRSDPRAVAMIERAFSDPEAVIWAHNAQFESVITHYLWKGKNKPALGQWRCTAALMRKMGLKSSLEDASVELGLKTRKNTRGYALIRKFCVMQVNRKTGERTRIMPQDAPVEWQEFLDYCVQDVRTEIEVYKVLKPVHLKGFELQSFQQDMILNHRGIPVNTPALRNAKKIIELVMAEANEEFVKLTGLQPTQRDKVLKLLQERGVEIENMRKKTLAAWLDEDDETEETYTVNDGDAKTRKIVELYSALGYTAHRKVFSMLTLASPDSRVRGTLMWYGAGTGRSSSVKLQAQNFKRAEFKDTAEAFRIIETMPPALAKEILEALWGNAIKVIASCIRHFIKGPLNDADLSAAEARMVMWLAGQEDALEMFRRGAQMYEEMAGFIFDKPASQIDPEGQERFIGKESILGCGYNLGWEGFKNRLRIQYGKVISDELAKKAVYGYRERWDQVPELWKDIEWAAKSAIRAPGSRFYAGKHLSFSTGKLAGVPFLIMRLPSGRNLYYPHPKIEMVMNEKFGKELEQITYYGRITGKGKNVYGRITTYGGSLLENASQALTGDFLNNGMFLLEAQGFDPFLPIHDQVLGPNDEARPIKEFTACLSTSPDWANGLPMKAAGKITPFYLK